MSHLSLFFSLLSTECSRIANAKLSERWIMNIEWKRDEKEKEEEKNQENTVRITFLTLFNQYNFIHHNKDHISIQWTHFFGAFVE